MEQVKEIIMRVVCELCHYPYVLENQEDLDDVCLNCPVEEVVEAQLCTMSTATVKGVYTE